MATTKDITKDTPSITTATHAFDKALSDARSAKGRIDSKLPAGVLLRASQAKGKGRDLTEFDLSTLGEADLVKRKKACSVISAFAALERAVAAFRD